MGKSYDSEGMEDSGDVNELGDYISLDDIKTEDVKMCSPTSYLLGNLEGRLLVVKVGSEKSPATPKDIKNVKRELDKVLKGVNCKVWVTHHSIDINLL